MKTGFTPIQLQQYVELRLRANLDARRAELIGQLDPPLVPGVPAIDVSVALRFGSLPHHCARVGRGPGKFRLGLTRDGPVAPRIAA